MVDLIRDGTFSIEQADQLDAIQKKIDGGDEIDQFDRALMDLYQRAMICRGVANPQMKIVDKAIGDTAPGELSIHEVPRADYDLLFLAIAELCGLLANTSSEQESVVNKEPVEGDRFRAEGDGGSEGSHEMASPANGGAPRRDGKKVRKAAQRPGHAAVGN
jgi:hypothetical protein